MTAVVAAAAWRLCVVAVPFCYLNSSYHRCTDLILIGREVKEPNTLIYACSGRHWIGRQQINRGGRCLCPITAMHHALYLDSRAILFFTLLGLDNLRMVSRTSPNVDDMTGPRYGFHVRNRITRSRPPNPRKRQPSQPQWPNSQRYTSSFPCHLHRKEKNIELALPAGSRLVAIGSYCPSIVQLIQIYSLVL